MFADHMPFKPPALDAVMYLSESDMQYQRNKGIKKINECKAKFRSASVS